jgi:hypothetical protein
MRLLLAALALASSAALAGSTLSWWLTIRLDPLDTTYRGLPVSQLSEPLQRFSPLSCDSSAKQFTPAQCAEVKSNDAHFQAIGDFNDDGEREIAQSGVAKLPNGSLVRVLIISNQSSPEINQLFFLPDNGFSVIYLDSDGALSWNECMECGHAVEIRWDASTKTYVVEVPESYGAEPSNNSFKRTAAPIYE